MPYVMLKRDWPADSFRRSVSDEAGLPIKVILFPRGEPVELGPKEYAAVRQDLGVALDLVELVTGKMPRVVKDNELAHGSAPAAVVEPPTEEAETKMAASRRKDRRPLAV